MEKRKEFTRDTIEVCRNCKATGQVYSDSYSTFPPREVCPVCQGSGLVRKQITGVVVVTPYEKP